jgi:membrane protein DedA with SNARE-associated domain
MGARRLCAGSLAALLCSEFRGPNNPYMESLLSWLSQYGYAGLFGLLLLGIVGLPVPDETLLVFSGYLISTGRLQPLLTFLAGFAGSVCGISLSYTIGRTLGHRVVLRYGRFLHVTEPRIDRVHRWFRRAGDWLLMIGYFIPGVRHFTALVAGMSELEYPTFARFAYAGAAIWVATFLLVGYFVGEHWRDAMSLIHRYTLAFVAVLAAAALLGWWIRRRRAK